jgi:hypothetical protein
MPEARQVAEQLASALGLPASRVSETSSLGGFDIRVIVGADSAGV